MRGLTDVASQPLITSAANPAVKLLRGLRLRKERDRRGLAFIEGIRIVGEAATLAGCVDSLVVAPGLLTSAYGQETAARLQMEGVPVLRVSDDVFRQLSLRDGPQGIGAVVRQRWVPLAQVRPVGDELWVALEQVQDPGNLGSILRTADAVGARGLILVGPSTDPYDPAAIRASMGSVLTMQLVRADTAEFVNWRQARCPALIGTSGSGASDYRAVRYPQAMVLLSGSERQGLSPELLPLCDAVVRIPMVGRPDSLNLAVATSVVLYEVFSQRHAPDEILAH